MGMLFAVPGVDHVLPLKGRARIVRPARFFAELAARGLEPALAVVVEIEELFVHCGRAFRRCDARDTETWPEPETLPTSGQLFKSQLSAARFRPSPIDRRTRGGPCRLVSGRAEHVGVLQLRTLPDAAEVKAGIFGDPAACLLPWWVGGLDTHSSSADMAQESGPDSSAHVE